MPFVQQLVHTAH